MTLAKTQNIAGTIRNCTCRHAQTMIRICTSQSEKRFHCIKPTHAVARFASSGKFADVIVRVVFTAEKIAVKRQDDFRLVEIENRTDRLPERLRRRALMD